MTKLKPSQKKVTELSSYTWKALQAVFEVSGKKRPPVYLFLSPESKGSLKSRGIDEKDFVHFQQERKGGATLKSPPAAWVSTLDQAVEETGHLFALVYKKDKLPLMTTVEEELNTTILHEAFGRFAHCIILGPPPKKTRAAGKTIKIPEDIWRIGHQEGYRLGEKLAELYFGDALKKTWLKDWLRSSWTGKGVRQVVTRLNLKVQDS